jgi:hypothetical protein
MFTDNEPCEGPTGVCCVILVTFLKVGILKIKQHSKNCKDLESSPFSDTPPPTQASIFPHVDLYNCLPSGGPCVWHHLLSSCFPQSNQRPWFHPSSALNPDTTPTQCRAKAEVTTPSLTLPLGLHFVPGELHSLRPLHCNVCTGDASSDVWTVVLLTKLKCHLLRIPLPGALFEITATAEHGGAQL